MFTIDAFSHRAIEGGSQNPDLRVRARNLNTQAIAQLGRLQKLGIEVQQCLKSSSTRNVSANYPSALVDFADPGAFRNPFHVFTDPFWVFIDIQVFC